MLKSVEDNTIITEAPNMPKTVKGILAKDKHTSRLVELLGLDPNDLHIEFVDGHYSISGRCELTDVLAQRILTNYHYSNNRKTGSTHYKVLQLDMQEGTWLNIADPGMIFGLSDGKPRLADGHNRLRAASSTPELSQHPLKMKVKFTSVPTSRFYGKTDLNVPKGVAVRDKAANMAERLDVSDTMVRWLSDGVKYYLSEGSNSQTADEKVFVQRDETRHAMMIENRDLIVEMLSPLGGNLKEKTLTDMAKAADYRGSFTPKRRWAILKSKEVQAAFLHVIKTSPRLKDRCIAFFQELMTFDAQNECQHWVAFDEFATRERNINTLAPEYEIRYNATLIVLRDYLNSAYTDGDELSLLNYSATQARTKKMETSSAADPRFEDHSFDLTIGGYTKRIGAFKFIAGRGK